MGETFCIGFHRVSTTEVCFTVVWWSLVQMFVVYFIYLTLFDTVFYHALVKRFTEISNSADIPKAPVLSSLASDDLFFFDVSLKVILIGRCLVKRSLRNITIIVQSPFSLLCHCHMLAQNNLIYNIILRLQTVLKTVLHFLKNEILSAILFVLFAFHISKNFFLTTLYHFKADFNIKRDNYF